MRDVNVAAISLPANQVYSQPQMLCDPVVALTQPSITITRLGFAQWMLQPVMFCPSLLQVAAFIGGCNNLTLPSLPPSLALMQTGNCDSLAPVHATPCAVV